MGYPNPAGIPEPRWIWVWVFDFYPRWPLSIRTGMRIFELYEFEFGEGKIRLRLVPLSCLLKSKIKLNSKYPKFQNQSRKESSLLLLKRQKSTHSRPSFHFKCYSLIRSYHFPKPLSFFSSSTIRCVTQLSHISSYFLWHYHSLTILTI
jgi:hypothetical protein